MNNYNSTQSNQLLNKLPKVLAILIVIFFLYTPLHANADWSGYTETEGTWGNYTFSYNEDSHVLTLSGSGQFAPNCDIQSYFWINDVRTIAIPSEFTGADNTGRALFKLDNVQEYTTYGSGDNAYAQDGVLYCKYQYNASHLTLLDYPNGKDGTNFIIPESIHGLGVHYLGENSFYGVSTINTIELNNGIWNVGPNCFSGSSLSTLVVSNQSTWFMDNAFGDCKNFTTIRIAPGKSSSKFFVEDNVLYGQNNVWMDDKEYTYNDIILYPSAKPGATFEIPSGVQRITSSAFDGALNIKTLKVPVTVTTADQYAFDNKYIDKFYIPSTVKIANGLTMRSSTYDNEPVTIYSTSTSDIAKYAKNNNINFVANADPSKITPVSPFTFGSNNIYVPGAPASVKASVTGLYNKVKVSWSKTTDADGYLIQYRKSSSKTWSNASSTLATSWTKSGLTGGTSYIFKVTPYAKVGTTKYPGTAKTITIKTLSLKVGTPTISKSTSKLVKIKWSNIANESGYQISKSTKKTGTYIVATYKTTSGTYKKISAKKGTTYYYKVRAYKTINGYRVYGPWSTSKAYKIK